MLTDLTVVMRQAQQERRPAHARSSPFPFPSVVLSTPLSSLLYSAVCSISSGERRRRRRRLLQSSSTRFQLVDMAAGSASATASLSVAAAAAGALRARQTCASVRAWPSGQPPQQRALLRLKPCASLAATAAPPPQAGGGGALLGRPLEDVYKVRVERGAVARARAEALRVMETWSSWRTAGRCRMPWDWQVDQLVYIVSGEVKVIPAGAVHGDDYMHFVTGDLVRYPRWFEADLYFEGPYEERYRFLAYGDDN